MGTIFEASSMFIIMQGKESSDFDTCNF